MAISPPMDALMMESPGTSKKFALEIIRIRNLDKNQFTCPQYMTEWIVIFNVVDAYFRLLVVLIVNVDAIF
jgi:hypothetical protein